MAPSRCQSGRPGKNIVQVPAPLAVSRQANAASPSMSRSTLQLAIIIIVLCGLVATVFHPTLDAEFLEWDDDHNVYLNERLSPLNGENLHWMFFDVGRDTRYKALSWVVWSLLRAGFGLHAPAFHVANVVLHALNVCLLLFLLLRLLDVAGVMEPSRRLLPAALAAAFWAVHPLRVEPVAWVTGLPYHLSLFFLLLALLCYLQLDFTRSVWRQPHYWATLGLQLLAMLSYPMPAGAIAIFVGLNIFPLRRVTMDGWQSLRNRGNLRIAGELLPVLAISALLMGASLYGAHIRQGIHGPPPTLEQFPLAQRAAQAGYVWFYHLWKPLLPIHLSPVYQTFVRIDPAAPRFLLSGIAVVGLSLLAWRWRTRRPALTALWIAHLGVLVPVLGINVLGHVPADRYTIIHGIILSGALALVLSRPLSEQNRTAAQTLIVAALLVFTVQSHRLCHPWRDNITFFTRQLETLPPGGAQAQAHLRLGGAYARRGDHQSAVNQYRAAKEAFPAIAVANLPYLHAESLYALGRFAEAAGQYRAAAKLRPDAHEIWYGLSLSLIQIGAFEEAAAVCREAVQRHPEIPEFASLLQRLESLPKP